MLGHTTVWAGALVIIGLMPDLAVSAPSPEPFEAEEPSGLGNEDRILPEIPADPSLDLEDRPPFGTTTGGEAVAPEVHYDPDVLPTP
ncbi:MAG: hypothetical protein GY953_19210, partial [bacterium]|nr:hypothetical protein [bacterium]